MEQHPVPQNVTSFQFRLIGEMTIKQFGFLAVCSVTAYICYKLPLPSFFTLPMAVGVFLLGFGLAFVPVEERPMDVWILAFIKSIYSPTQYVWRRETPVPEPVPATKAQTAQLPTSPVTATQAPPQPRTHPAPAAPAPPAQQPAPGTVPVQTPPVAVPQQKPVTPQTQPASPAVSAKPAQKPSAQKTGGLMDLIRRFFAGGSAPKPETPPQTTPKQPAPAVTLTTAAPAAKPRQRTGFMALLRGLFAPPRKQPGQPAPQPAASEASPFPQPEPVSGPPPRTAPQGPDVFAGVKTPSIVGQTIDLPKVTKEEEERRVTDAAREAQKQAEAVAQAKTNELEGKLKAMQEELKTKSVSQERILELQQQLTDVLSERDRMQSELQNLRVKLENAKHVAPAPTRQAEVARPQENRGPTVKVITAETAVRAGLPKLTTFPNIITGIIKDYSGNLLPGVLVTVRDTEGTPVRALKTNKLGQFAASTPLTNNTYTIEVEDPRGRFVFDRIQIALNGSLVPAIEVVAKSEKEISRKKLEAEIFGKQQL